MTEKAILRGGVLDGVEVEVRGDGQPEMITRQGGAPFRPVPAGDPEDGVKKSHTYRRTALRDELDRVVYEYDHSE